MGTVNRNISIHSTRTIWDIVPNKRHLSFDNVGHAPLDWTDHQFRRKHHPQQISMEAEMSAIFFFSAIVFNLRALRNWRNGRADGINRTGEIADGCAYFGSIQDVPFDGLPAFAIWG